MVNSPATPCMRMQGVSKRFGPTMALDHVDFEVRPGEVMALVGENGAGKSTLMKILSGACHLDEGTIELFGKPFSPRTPHHSRRAGIAMIYQELSLAVHLSVEENILLGVEPRRGLLMDRANFRSLALEVMQQVGLEDMAPSTRVAELSIAERQLVEIARSVAVGCDLLVLDEPTSSLTGEDVPRLFKLIREWKSRGKGIVYISHFLEEVKEISDSYTVLRDGRVVDRGSTCEVGVSQIVTRMVGRKIEDMYCKSPRKLGAEVLSAKDLRGEPLLPVNANFSLRKGEVLGLAGLMGSGRTELLRTLFGLSAVRSGRIRIRGVVCEGSPSHRWLLGVGMLSEDRREEGLAQSLSVANNLTLSKLQGLGPRWVVIPQLERRQAESWIDELGINCQGSQQAVRYLSGGNQQKVALARLLYHDVDIMLLDEPTRGIDVGSKAEIYRLIDFLATGDPSRGIEPKAILVASSHLSELLGICDRITVMCRGVLQPPTPVEGLDEHTIMMMATGSGCNAS